mmetsp:Transcript_16240/g.50910  ORF Transcript_16240/g.50910 Transcript_16240/m.50910 type:complete len:376 (+) Transcript_16240:1031-2158(+)
MEAHRSEDGRPPHCLRVLALPRLVQLGGCARRRRPGRSCDAGCRGGEGLCARQRDAAGRCPAGHGRDGHVGYQWPPGLARLRRTVGGRDNGHWCGPPEPGRLQSRRRALDSRAQGPREAAAGPEPLVHRPWWRHCEGQGRGAHGDERRRAPASAACDCGCLHHGPGPCGGWLLRGSRDELGGRLELQGEPSAGQLPADAHPLRLQDAAEPEHGQGAEGLGAVHDGEGFRGRAGREGRAPRDAGCAADLVRPHGAARAAALRRAAVGALGTQPGCSDRGPLAGPALRGQRPGGGRPAPLPLRLEFRRLRARREPCQDRRPGHLGLRPPPGMRCVRRDPGCGCGLRPCRCRCLAGIHCGRRSPGPAPPQRRGSGPPC